jgi:hypothetical protein
MEQLGDNTDYEEAHLPIHELIDAIPDYDERTRIAASNPLACVNAFTVLCKIALCTLFGVRSVFVTIARIVIVATYLAVLLDPAAAYPPLGVDV